MSKPVPSPSNSSSRREFLKSSALLGGAALAGGLSPARAAQAAGSDVIKVGLIGCGGRGAGAAVNAMNAGADIRVTAMADIFKERITGSLKQLQKLKGPQVDVDDDHQFVGFDAYQKVIDSGVDVVAIAPTSHFIPAILKAAVDGGKHVFCEKPHAIDVPGAQLCKQACDEAKEKGLSVVSGLCWRYDLASRETMNRVADGAIGRIMATEALYLSRPYGMRPRIAEWSETMFQFQNWYHFNWLSGDQTGQQLIHSLDLASWALGDRPPIAAWGMGGRQVCVDPNYGDQFDHHAAVFEYDDGLKVSAFCRDMPGCHINVSNTIVGTKGRAILPLRCAIEGENPWRYRGPKVSQFDLEHKALFDSIRAGTPINNGRYMFLSSMLAVMAQTVCYTGERITWDQLLKSKLDFSQPSYSFDMEPPVRPGSDGRYLTAMPGITKFG